MKISITISKRCLAGLAGVLLFCGLNIQAAARQGLSQLLRAGRGLQPGVSGVQQPQMQRFGNEPGLIPSKLPSLSVSEESGSVAGPSQPSTSRPQYDFVQNEELRRQRQEALRDVQPLQQSAEPLQTTSSSLQTNQPATSAQEVEQLVDVASVRAKREERLAEKREEYARLEDDLAQLKEALPELEKAVQGPFGWFFPGSKKAAAEQNLAHAQEKIASMEQALIRHKAEQAQLEQSLQNVEADVAQRNAYIAALPQKMQKELQGQINALTQRIANNIKYLSGLPARERKNLLQDYYDRYEKEYTQLWMHYTENDPVTKEYFIDAWHSIEGTEQTNKIKQIISGELPLDEISKPFEKPVVVDTAWYQKLIPGNLVQQKYGSVGLQQRRQFSTVVPSVPLPSLASKRSMLQESEAALPSRVEEAVESAPVKKKSGEKQKRADSYVTRAREGALAPFIPVGIRNVIHRKEFERLNAVGVPKGEQRKAIRSVDYDAISRGLLEKMVSGEKPQFMPLQPLHVPRPLSGHAPRQVADLTPLSSAAEQALVPVVASASTALVPFRQAETQASEMIEPNTPLEQGTLTVIANKPVADAFIADAQSGEAVPGFIVQYKPGQQGNAGELVIASQDQQIKLDLNVFNADRLQPQLRRMLAGLMRRNEPVTLAVYPKQGQLMLTDASAQSSHALVPFDAGAQPGQPDIMNQLVDVLANEETVVLRFETQEAAQPALPAPSEQTQEAQQPIKQPQRSEPSQPREQARPYIPDSPAETSQPQRTYEQQRAVERKEMQPKITREQRLVEQRPVEERPGKRRPDLSQQAERIRRQRAATQAVEAAGQRAEAQRQAEQLEQMRERELGESTHTEQLPQAEEVVLAQAEQITPQESEESISAEEIAEQAERDRAEQFRMRLEEREAFEALDRQEAAERAQAARREQLQAALRRNAEQAQLLQSAPPMESRVIEGSSSVSESLPVAQTPSATGALAYVPVEAPTVHVQIPSATINSGSTPVLSTGTPSIVGTSTAHVPGIAPDMQPRIEVSESTSPAQVMPSITPTRIASAAVSSTVQVPSGTPPVTTSTGDASQLITGVPSGADADVDITTGVPSVSGQPATNLVPERNRIVDQFLQTPLSRHRAAILAAMRENRPIARNIIHDFDTYSINIRDMLLVYNRQVVHCRAIRSWNNQAKTEADVVLAKIKTNIRQMLDRQGLTVEAQS